ncbi:MAG TPA: hypothetical protein VHS08_00935 [Candidatus Acidoferrales bacterium]|jgi:hypothetical protein|nr:hypothetical protein [Candidatus Acidoferrales bacterium]
MEFLRTFFAKPSRLSVGLIAFVLVMAALPLIVRAQESSSRPADRPTSPANLPSMPAVKNPDGTIVPIVPANSPAAALRDVLQAACAQNSGEFSRHLTARSKESFERLTPAARVALMKRFVLLNEPGKATPGANPAGRPIVRCETPDVATEMSIGGTDTRDNLAFLPMELRDVTDSTGANVHQITMGLVRENGQWVLLSIGVLLLDIPSLEVEWDSEEAEANEITALGNLRRLADAVETYRRTYFRLPESLASLGPPPSRASGKNAPPKLLAATREHAGLLDEEFAAGNKDGYEFRIIIAGAETLGAPAKYQLSAIPSAYGRTGKRSFFRDADGGWHAADHGGAVGSASDPVIQ